MDENSVQKTEIPPKEIFNLMKTNIFDNFTHFSLFSINKDYINSRKALFSLLHKITIRMGFKSQTFFLCAHYLDIIFTKKKRIHLNLNILGLSCLCLAAKFCENDPMVPHLQYFIKIFNNINGYKNAILMSELKRGEVAVLKILNYKLNYYTIYDFNSFLFGHGILKIEQLKEIENKNKKLYRSSRKKFVVNSTNSLMIKNILEKVYKKSRAYLDIIIKNSKICFKYNPMFISIYIMKKSVEEVLANERKINSCEKKEKEDFYEKNNQCFRQILRDFYKINYEENEQYKKILEDEEINEIFGNKKKNEEGGADPAPLANKNIHNEEDTEENNNNYPNKNLFINTYTSGFYNKMKIKEDIIDINKKNKEVNKKSESNSEESKEEDDLEMNLNINEIQKAKNKKMNNNSTSYNFYKEKENKENKLIENKYAISTSNREMNTISNKKSISNNNYNLTYSVEPYRNKIYINPNTTEKTSPLKISINNNGNLTGIKKYVKIKGINTGLDKERSYNLNLNNNIENNSSTNIIKNNYNYNTIKKFEKQPYFKKLINNESNINSINRNAIPSYYLTNTNSNINKNKIDINYRNTVNSTSINTYNRIKTKNTRNKNPENNLQSVDDNVINYNKKEQPLIISTTSSRFRKMLYRNKKEENNNNISTEVKNANDYIIQDKEDKNKNEIESYTQYNWNNNKNSILNKYRNNNIFIRKNRILNMNNDNIDNIENNNEDKRNLTSTNFYKNNLNIPNQKRIIVNLSNSNKENINNSFDISNKYPYNKNNINNEPEKKISVNTIENSNSQRVYQSIRHKYLNMKNKANNESKNISANNPNNNSNEISNDKNSRTSNYFYKKNINENKNEDVQNIDNKTRYKKFAGYSISNIINKTKELFSKNNNSNIKEENKRIIEKRNNELNSNIISNNNNSTFYKSQQNFYQPKNKAEININNNNRKIVINNNININIGNKSNEYPKYKNIYKKNNVQPQTKNNVNQNDNKKNNNKVNKGINLSNILNKFQFYRKVINKNNNK